MKHDDFRKLVLSDLSTKQYYLDDLVHDTGVNIMRARLRANLTQDELARKLQTTQSVIARLESGGRTPSLQYLRKIALALGTYLIPPSFQSIHSNNQIFYITTSFPANGYPFQPKYQKATSRAFSAATNTREFLNA